MSIFAICFAICSPINQKFYQLFDVSGFGFYHKHISLAFAVIISHIARGGFGRFPSLGEMCHHFTMLAKKMPFVIFLKNFTLAVPIFYTYCFLKRQKECEVEKFRKLCYNLSKTSDRRCDYGINGLG